MIIEGYDKKNILDYFYMYLKQLKNTNSHHSWGNSTTTTTTTTMK